MTWVHETRHYYTIEFPDGTIYTDEMDEVINYDKIEDAELETDHHNKSIAATIGNGWSTEEWRASGTAHIVEHYDNVIHLGIEEKVRRGIDS